MPRNRSDLTRRAFVGVLVSTAAAPAVATPAGDAAATLDQPFQFLVHLPGWTVTEFSHDSDMFASWGTVVLSRRPASKSSPAGNLQQAVHAARRGGWRPGPPSDSPDALDLQALGIAASSVPVTLRLNRGAGAHHDPTRYLLVLWASEDASRLIAQARVDTS